MALHHFIPVCLDSARCPTHHSCQPDFHLPGANSTIPPDCVLPLDERNLFFSLDEVNGNITCCQLHLSHGYHYKVLIRKECIRTGEADTKIRIIRITSLKFDLRMLHNNNKKVLIHMNQNLLNIWYAPSTASHWFEVRLSIFWSHL